MPQKNIELILLRQFSDYLATPIFLLDNAGTLVYFNAAAADLFKFHFSETGEMDIETWSSLIVPRNQTGEALNESQWPIHNAMQSEKPILQSCYLNTFLGLHHVVINAIPVKDHADDLVGLLTFFWKS